MKNQTLKYILPLIALCTFTLAPSWQDSEPKSYTITELGTLGGPSSFPNDINNRGQVVGFAQNTVEDPVFGFSIRACTWENGVPIDLGTFGGLSSDATCLNDRGIIAGGSQIDPNSDIHVTMVWDRRRRIHKIGTLAGPHSAAYGINNRLQLAGHTDIDEIDANTGKPFVHAYFWERGIFTDLGTLGGGYSSASRMNERSQVVGTADTDTIDPLGFSNFHGFLWQDGVMTNLGTLGGRNGTAYGINDRGQVVGTSDITDVFDPVIGFYTYHGYLWEKGKKIDLGTLPGGQLSDFFGINNRGDLVGLSGTGEVGADGFPVLHAVIWKNGVMTDLNTLIPPDSNWELILAWDINDRGEIVGFGEHDGKFLGFLLQPSHETHSDKDFSPSGMQHKGKAQPKTFPRDYRRLAGKPGHHQFGTSGDEVTSPMKEW